MDPRARRLGPANISAFPPEEQIIINNHISKYLWVVANRARRPQAADAFWNYYERTYWLGDPEDAIDEWCYPWRRAYDRDENYLGYYEQKMDSRDWPFGLLQHIVRLGDLGCWEHDAKQLISDIVRTRHDIEGKDRNENYPDDRRGVIGDDMEEALLTARVRYQQAEERARYEQQRRQADDAYWLRQGKGNRRNEREGGGHRNEYQPQDDRQRDAPHYGNQRSPGPRTPGQSGFYQMPRRDSSRPPVRTPTTPTPAPLTRGRADRPGELEENRKRSEERGRSDRPRDGQRDSRQRDAGQQDRERRAEQQRRESHGKERRKVYEVDFKTKTVTQKPTRERSRPPARSTTNPAPRAAPQSQKSPRTPQRPKSPRTLKKSGSWKRKNHRHKKHKSERK